MSMEDATAKAFLLELYRRTGGDPGAKQSMHDVGAAVGLDKAQAGKTAEALIGLGWAEIKTLSGGIGITAEGIQAAQQQGGAQAGATLILGAGPWIEDQDRRAIEQILTEIKQQVGQAATEYARLEEMVIDIKTIEVHLLSPRPRSAVIKAVLRGLQTTLATERRPRFGRAHRTDGGIMASTPHTSNYAVDHRAQSGAAFRDGPGRTGGGHGGPQSGQCAFC